MNNLSPVETFRSISDDILEQNHLLLDRLDAPDFNPAIELDCTRNNAAYRITQFFDAVSLFPYGEVPSEIADETVRTTDQLIDKILARYGCDPKVKECALLAGQAFRSAKILWRLKNPVAPRDPAEYTRELRLTADVIVTALCELNLALALATEDAPPPTAAERPLGETPSVAPPDLRSRTDCRRFLHETYDFLRAHYANRIHTESEAVNYILLEAQAGDAYYGLCETARRIKETFNWERATFMTYCKKSPPKPRTLKRAASARAKKRRVARELEGS